jgi:hypothetical protein
MTRDVFRGHWRIERMELWDAAYLDLERPAFIAFAVGRLGEFQFGAVHGWLDYRVVQRDGQPIAEFSWEGVNDGDPICGRGWVMHSDGRLTGRLFIHTGDDSSFEAIRLTAGRPKRRSRRGGA